MGRLGGSKIVVSPFKIGAGTYEFMMNDAGIPNPKPLGFLRFYFKGKP